MARLMPIRAEYKALYGAAWRRYRLVLIERHGRLCTRCGRVCLKYLNFAHTTHDPKSSSVVAMCAACHNRHDAAFRYAMWRRNRAKRYGQGWLWPEVQWAPYPAWMRPKTRRRKEERLF